MRRAKPISVAVKAPTRGLVTRLPSLSADLMPTRSGMIQGTIFTAASIKRAAAVAQNVRYEDGVVCAAPGYIRISLSSELLQDIVAYWPLNEASGTRYDATPNYNNLTDVPGPAGIPDIFSDAGILGAAALFPGVPPGSPTDHAVRPRVCGRVPLVDRRERRVLSGRQPPWFARSVRRDGFGPELIAPRLQLVNVDRGPHAHRPPSAVAGLVVEKLCPVCSADDHRGARDRHVETSVRRTICVDALFAAPPQIDLRTLANAEVSYRNASGSFQCLQCHAVWQSDTYVDIDGLAAWSAPCPACGLYVLRELANLHHSQRAARVDPDRALLGALQEHLRAHGFRYSEIAHLTPDGEGGSVAKQRRRVEDRLRKRRTRQ